MNVLRFLTCTLFGAALAAGCGGGGGRGNPGIVAQPYESCLPQDVCAEQLYCAMTILPDSTGYAGGYFCTSGCTYDSDCFQDPSNYPSVCVGNQCYQTCPAGNSACPSGQACFTFNDNGLIDLCTP
jgi:hypothetical protein